MTIAEMRVLLGLGDEVSDATVVEAYAIHIGAAGNAGLPPEIITLDEAKEFCRIDGDYDDNTLEIIIAAATDAAMAVADDWDHSDPVPPRLKLAVLTHVARVYGEREDGADMPPSAIRLLGPMRTLEV